MSKTKRKSPVSSNIRQISSNSVESNFWTFRSSLAAGDAHRPSDRQSSGEPEWGFAQLQPQPVFLGRATAEMGLVTKLCRPWGLHQPHLQGHLAWVLWNFCGCGVVHT
eukprot:6195326-Pleurochrysis_carterae.AAC.2